MAHIRSGCSDVNIRKKVKDWNSLCALSGSPGGIYSSLERQWPTPKAPAVKETGLNGPAAFSSLLPALGFMLRFQEEKEIQPHHISKLNLNKRDPNLYLSGSKPPPIVTPHLSWIGSGIQSPLPTQTFYCVVRCSHHGQCSRPLLLISLEKKMSYSEIVLPYVLLPYLQIPIISSFIEVIGATLFSYPCQ